MSSLASPQSVWNVAQDANPLFLNDLSGKGLNGDSLYFVQKKHSLSRQVDLVRLVLSLAELG